MAAIGALHATVAGEEITAHAEREAMRLVRAEELARPHGGHVVEVGGRGGCCCRDLVGLVVNERVIAAVIEPALEAVPVFDEGKFPAANMERKRGIIYLKSCEINKPSIGCRIALTTAPFSPYIL